MKSMEVNFRIFPELKIILEWCKNQTSVEEFIRMKQAEISHPLYNPEFNIITDLRDYELFESLSKLDSISKLTDYLRKLEFFNKVAILTRHPHQVMIGEIFKQLAQTLPMDIEIFSTLKAAMQFVDCPLESYNYIDEKLLQFNITVSQG